MNSSMGLVAKIPSRQLSHRNKLKEKYLNVLITIKTSKCYVADFELVINMWKEKKACRIYKKCLINKLLKNFCSLVFSCYRYS